MEATFHKRKLIKQSILDQLRCSYETGSVAKHQSLLASGYRVVSKHRLNRMCRKDVTTCILLLLREAKIMHHNSGKGFYKLTKEYIHQLVWKRCRKKLFACSVFLTMYEEVKHRPGQTGYLDSMHSFEKCSVGRV